MLESNMQLQFLPAVVEFCKPCRGIYGHRKCKKLWHVQLAQDQNYKPDPPVFCTSSLPMRAGLPAHPV